MLKERELTWVWVREGEVTDAGFLKQTQRIWFVQVKHEQSIKTQKTPDRKKRENLKKLNITKANILYYKGLMKRCFPWITKKEDDW